MDETNNENDFCIICQAKTLRLYGQYFHGLDELQKKIGEQLRALEQAHEEGEHDGSPNCLCSPTEA